MVLLVVSVLPDCCRCCYSLLTTCSRRRRHRSISGTTSQLAQQQNTPLAPQLRLHFADLVACRAVPESRLRPRCGSLFATYRLGCSVAILAVRSRRHSCSCGVTGSMRMDAMLGPSRSLTLRSHHPCVFWSLSMRCLASFNTRLARPHTHHTAPVRAPTGRSSRHITVCMAQQSENLDKSTPDSTWRKILSAQEVCVRVSATAPGWLALRGVVAWGRACWPAAHTRLAFRACWPKESWPAC